MLIHDLDQELLDALVLPVIILMITGPRLPCLPRLYYDAI